VKELFTYSIARRHFPRIITSFIFVIRSRHQISITLRPFNSRVKHITEHGRIANAQYSPIIP
jgi:hypothetical protein